MADFTFKIRNRWDDRAVACRVAMCLGLVSPSWDGENKLPPYWQEDGKKWQLNDSNDYWLRKIETTGPDEESKKQLLKWDVRTFKLSYRYTTSDREEALLGLCKWFGSDLFLG